MVSQYLGSKDSQNSNLAAGQLYLLSLLFSLVCMAGTLVWNRQLLGLLFGQVEADVMDASVIYLRISLLLPGPGPVQRRRRPVPQHEQDKGDHEHFPADERDQRGGQRHWHLRPLRGGGRRGLALHHFPGLCRCRHHRPVLFQKEPGHPAVEEPACLERRHDPAAAGHCRTQLHRERPVSAGEGGVKLHYRHVRHRADRRQRRGPEHLVPGGAGGVGPGSGLHHRGGPVHGRQRSGGRGLLYEKS